LTIELTPRRGTRVRLFQVNLLNFRLRTIGYAHALSRLTPKDTLLALNTCMCCVSAALQCARPCIASLLSHPFGPALRLARYEDAHTMRITQSISLSNIQTFLKKARPKAVGNLPVSLEKTTSKDCRPASKSASHAGAAIRKQRMKWWS